jgi:type IV pilus assembly protein PilO
MNKILYQIADLPWSRVFMIGIAMMAIYYFAFYDDGAASAARLRQSSQRLAEAERKLQETKTATANADRFESEVKLTLEQFDHISDFMPEKMSSADLTTMVNDLAKKVGVRVTKTEPQTTSEKTDFYETSKISATLEGTFSQLAKFLSEVSKLQRMLTFDHIDMSTMAGSEPGAPKLNFNAVLVGYRYLRNSKTDTKDVKKDTNGGATAKP